MNFDSTHHSQCPARNGMDRRTVEEKSVESCNKVELSAEAMTSGPKVFLKLCCVCRDCGLRRAHRGGSQCLCAISAEEDFQNGKNKETAAQMPNTKHKARAPVACRQLIDGNEAVPLRDQSRLTLTGTVSLANLDTKVIPSLQASKQDHTDVYKLEEEKHTERMQSYVWEQSRIKAHSCNVEPGRRSRNLHTAGIFPQEQICRERFCGTPFRLQ